MEDERRFHPSAVPPRTRRRRVLSGKARSTSVSNVEDSGIGGEGCASADEKRSEVNGVATRDAKSYVLSQ